MTKLLSGRIAKVPSANVSADRYQFIGLSEAEPDLGLPSAAGQVVSSNVTGSRYWLGLNTANVVESLSNLYFTNARSRAAISAGSGISYDSVTGIISTSTYSDSNTTSIVYAYSTTSNVIETGANLYFNNARVYAALSDANVTIGNLVVRGDIVARGNITAINILTANALVIRDIPITDELLRGNITGSYVTTTNITTNSITANIWNKLYTANVIETAGNLYYTNARARAALSAGSGITYDKANGIISAIPYTDSNAIVVLNTILNTANVNEYGSNLYFTNARVYTALSTANVTIGNLVVRQDIVAGGNITAINTISANSLIIRDNPISDELLRGNITGSYVRTSNIITNSITANIWNRLYTANVIETSGNLYFTNARVYASLIGANVTIGNIVVQGDIVAQGNITTVNTIVANAIIIRDNPITDEFLTGQVIRANVIAANTIISNVIFANSFIATGTGTPTLSSATNINLSANGKTGGAVVITSSALRFKGYTQTDRANVIAAAGDTLYNITSGTLQYYNGNVWTNVGYDVDPVVFVFASQLTTANIRELSNLYYTNARVYASLSDANIIIGNLVIRQDIVAGGNITAINTLTANALVIRDIPITDELLRGNITGSYVTTSAITTNSITANIWNRLYTANVIETSGNLYYTDARVNVAVRPILTTANVIEIGSNLYFTTARVNAAVQPMLTTANVIETSGNLYFTTSRVNAAVQPMLTTANVIETSGNLYFTNARARAAISAGSGIVYDTANGIISTAIGFGTLTTANVVESASNLYYTNARARAALSAGAGISYDSASGTISIGQNVSTTSNVTFGSVTILGNLYVFGNSVTFGTNTLVVNDTLIQLGYNNPGDVLDIGFIGQYVDSGIKHSGLIRDHESKKYFLFDNYAIDPGNDIMVANASTQIHYSTLVAQTFEGNVFGIVTSLANHTTSNLAEGINQYFTNVRVLQAVNPRLTTANVIETTNNLYYTDARVNAAVQPMLTTANVIETTNNLYFTNTRVYASLSTANVTIGNLVVRQDIVAGGNITAVNYLVANALIIRDNPLSDEFLSGQVIRANVLAANNFFTNSITANIWNNLYTANVIESANNLYFTNTRVYASLSDANVTLGNIVVRGDIVARGNITAVNYIVANALIIRDNPLSDEFLSGQIIKANTLAANNFFTNSITANIWNNLYTANVIETAGNLYYTNARSRAALSAGSGITYDKTTGIISANTTATSVSASLTTANVIETSGNLYFTNTRVLAALSTANVTIGNLVIRGDIVAQGNITAVNYLVANALIIRDNPLSDEFLSGQVIRANVLAANTISTNSITANIWNRLYTANVIETSGNLYFTNARARAALSAGTGIIYDTANGIISAVVGAGTLTTANINEFGSNLYFTNARVYASLSDANVTIGNIVVRGDIVARGNITAVNYIVANALIIRDNPLSDEFLSGQVIRANILAANTFFTNRITANIWNGLYTANVIETANSLYFTNARSRAAISAGTGIIYDTANGIISTNQYSDSNTIVVVNTKLTTANVIEVGANLYFNNTRVYAALSNANVIIGNLVVRGDIVAQGNITAVNYLVANALIIRDNPLSDEFLSGQVIRANTLAANTFFTNRITANIWNNLYTASVIESANTLYYTNARVLSLLSTSNVTIDNLTVSGDLIVQGNTVTLNTATVNVEDKNLLLGNGLPNAATADGAGITIAGANAILSYASSGDKFTVNKHFESTGNITAIGSITAANWNNLYTSNVIETSGNLYFTTSRVNVAVQPMLTTANVIETSGNLYFTNARVVSALYSADLTFANLSVQNKLTVGSGYLGQIYDVSNIFVKNSIADTVTSNIWNKLYTANVIETPNNLYFTNARARTAISAGLGITYDSATGIISANVLTGYNDANVNTVVRPMLTTANVIETTGNLYFTNARSRAAINSGLGITYDSANGIISANVLSGFNDANVNTAVRPMLTTANVIETSGNLYFTTSRVNVAVQPMLTTANVIENSSNLYFTNARVVAALSATSPIILNANGRISANVGAIVGLVSNVTYSSSYNNPTNVNAAIYFEFNESQIISGITSSLSYSLNRQVADAKNIMVIADGLVYIPQLDYTTAGNVLTLTENLGSNANIEVRYFGLKTTDYVSPSLLSTVNTFIGTGNVNYLLSINPVSKNYIEVNIDGIIQLSDSYSLNSKTLTFTEAPAVGANIDVRIWSGVVNASFAARTFTANGTVTQFSISSNLTAESILVFENGVAQVPIIDYTYTPNGIVTFATAPAANVVVQIRELGIATPDGSANVLNAIRNRDLQTGSLEPVRDDIFDLGDPTARYRNIFSSNVVTANSIVIAAPIVPANATYPGTTGTIAWSNNYIYVCIATNTWARAALTSW